MSTAKTIGFIRHGEAAHNVMISKGRQLKDAQVVHDGRSMLDPELTETGRIQASKLAQTLINEGHSYDIIISSPLLRALQTTELLLATKVPGNVKVIVTSLHTENGIQVDGDEVAGKPCQRGSLPIAAIRERFPDFDFSSLADPAIWTGSPEQGYYHPSPVTERVPVFRSWLSSLPSDHSILVVGHSGFYLKFLGGAKMGNCELVHRDICLECS